MSLNLDLMSAVWNGNLDDIVHWMERMKKIDGGFDYHRYECHAQYDRTKEWQRKLTPFYKRHDPDHLMRAWPPGLTPLMLASRRGHAHIVDYLIKNGADADLQNEDGDSSLAIAAQYNHLNIVRYLAACGAKIDVPNKDGETALFKAISFPEIAAFLIESGAEIDRRNNLGETPMMRAAEHGICESIKLLTKAGSRAELRDVRGKNALLKAAYNQKNDAVRMLLTHALTQDLPQKDDYWNEVLPIAAKNDDFEFVKELINMGADLEVTDNEYAATALMWAAENDSMKMTAALIAAGARIDFQNINGETALMKAARYIHPEIVSYLVGHGANLDLQDNRGQTALMLSGGRERFSIANQMAAAGANLNLQDGYSWTVLMMASEFGYIKAIKMFIKHGADPSLRNTSGECYLDILRQKHPAKCKTFEKNLAKEAAAKFEKLLPGSPDTEKDNYLDDMAL